MNAVMARGVPRPLLNGLTRSSPYGRRLMRLPAQVSSGASFVSLVHSLMLFILESHKTSSRFYSPTGRQILYTTIVVVAGYDRLPRCLSRYKPVTLKSKTGEGKIPSPVSSQKRKNTRHYFIFFFKILIAPSMEH